MPRYYLDTNMCVYALHRRTPHVLERLVSKSKDELVISTLVAAELAAGVAGSQRVQTNRAALEAFLAEVTVAPWEMSAVWHLAQHWHHLKTTGRLIGTIDLLLACQALADREGILVTHNVREFERIEGLRIEDWMAEAAGA